MLQAAWALDDAGDDAGAATLRRRAAALWGHGATVQDAIRVLDVLRRAGDLAAARTHAAHLAARPGLEDTDAAVLRYQEGLIAAGDTGRHLLSSALRPPARTPHVTHGRPAARPPAPPGLWETPVRAMTPPLEQRLQARLDRKAKPVGSLGRLEALAVQLGTIQATESPRVVDPVVLVFAGDHGTPTSAYPSSVTAAMVGAYLAGQAAINLLAAQAGARLLVVDAGVAAPLPPHPGLLDAKVAPGTQDWTQGPAMTTAQCADAMAAAASIVDALAAGGTTVLALGEMGIGNTASAALLAHKVAGLPLLAGPGAGHDPAGLARKQALMEAGAVRTPRHLDPLAALAEYGGFEVAMLAAAILRAAERRLCVVVDGVIVTAAALVAHALQPACLSCCVFAHRSAEPGHDAMLAYLNATPLLDLGLRLGEGTGAALALPLLRAAAGVLADMADLDAL